MIGVKEGCWEVGVASRVGDIIMKEVSWGCSSDS